jgi:hypothetical protein
MVVPLGCRSELFFFQECARLNSLHWKKKKKYFYRGERSEPRRKFLGKKTKIRTNLTEPHNKLAIIRFEIAKALS